MSQREIIKKINRLHKSLNGSTVVYNLNDYYSQARKIKQIQSFLTQRDEQELLTLSSKLRLKVQTDTICSQLINDAFSLVSEAVKRKLELEVYDTQLIVALALNEGKLAEMQTGEGKTLAAVFPVYLNALRGRGVHVLTFNDYLARRDALWMKPVYNFLGLTVGYIQQGMSKEERKAAYNCDITYLTAKEAGFDLLRDNLCLNKSECVQRGFDYAVIDEADSILIDESRIPLIIAGSIDDNYATSYSLPEFVKTLSAGQHFEFDEYERNFHYTEEGYEKIELFLGCGNLYDEKNIDLLTKLNCAVHAEFIFKRDIDYIVKNNKIELVDEFTGRIADKRRWPDGLQEALEQKEKLILQPKGKILNSITLQHFIKLYKKIGAMTATALAAEEEFKRFYNLDIVVVPTFKSCIRTDFEDKIFKTMSEKNKAVVEEIKNVHKTGRPILVGTRSVAESIRLAENLKQNNLDCEVLNAKNDEFEAEIISNAGTFGAITISTNMAGRGTDIKLGAGCEFERKKIAGLGGLYVIGTNKHDSSRIDNQLRGRSGRQGDPGSSRFFISLEDDLFIKYNLKKLFPAGLFKSLQDGEIHNKIVNNEVARVQRIVEAQNLEIKKTICKYSDLIEQHRKIVGEKRIKYLEAENIEAEIKSGQKFNHINNSSILVQSCRELILTLIDNRWSDYLAAISDLREGIHLMRLGGEEPFYVFQKETIKIFDSFFSVIEDDILRLTEELSMHQNEKIYKNKGLKRPSSTWTYLVNDNPFENLIGTMFAGNIGLSIGILLTWPLLMIMPLLKKIKAKTDNLN